MSEYEYYEFQTIDRPLTDSQMRDLRAISSRAAISRTRFSNYYTYGNLKANPRDLLRRYFHASLHFAHWHFVELAFRWPKSAVEMKALRRYAAGRALEVDAKGTDVVITMSAEREDFDPADDGQGWLSSLVALRTEIASGDERALYLAWLLGVQQGDVDDATTEPARPDGLGVLSPALESFIDIMGLDRDLVAAAVEGAPKASPALPVEAIDGWITSLDAREQAALLSRVARGDAGVGTELMRRFRRQRLRPRAMYSVRAAGELCRRAEALADRRRAVVLAREAKARERREREQTAARDRHLNSLARRQATAWRRVDALIATKRPGDYDAAIALLRDLREVGEQNRRSAEFAERLRALRGVHEKKPSLMARLRKAGL